ncbi:MAG: adenylate/guanylate cyclase domain-containing protein [Actinomycetota bacterium]
MICAICGTENEAARKFCKECGAPLALACPSCGAANSGDSKFCGECGSTLSTTAASPTASTTVAPSTERRLVSVLFADLVGFTTLSQHKDAEDVRELLTRYFDTARATIERHGGLVEKFIGDAVMAVWGTPIAHEDDAERAVRTALELVDGVEALGHEVGMDLRARAGVLTGEAAAMLGDTSQGMVTGDLVNTASRLQSAAEPGTVLVGEATYQAAGKAIAFAEVGSLTLKGKDEPVPAWRAVRILAQRGGAGRSEVLEPPFVGRTEELRLMKELLHATERERKARLVSVVGIGGIGKSRLAWEFLKYVDGLTEDVFWHQGRCPAYGDGITFWALGEMVRMRAGIAENDDRAGSRAKLSATVGGYVGDEEERRWIEPRLAHLLGLEEGSPGERDELFSAWRTFFERIAERGPTVMVFEDLQWADPGLLDFIESMLGWSRSHPILIVTLARPELADRRPNWGVEQRSFTAIRLEPLPDDAMAELIEGFVHGLPPEGVARVVERAEGVPLYAVETVRMLADRGILEARSDAFELVGDIGTLEIPGTLQALIAARLDSLAPEDRALLQDASVLGKSFPVEALAAITGHERETLEPRLRDLVKKEFLIQEGDPRSPERGQYAFLQSLIREVAYGTLSKADRRTKHLAAAHHLESAGDEELAGVVAAHYVEAFRATAEGPDAEALAVRARDWLSQAADRALSLGSPDQALTYADQALSITPEGRERANLLQQAGEAASNTADTDRAIAYLEEATTRFRDLGDVSAVAIATAKLAAPLRGENRTAEVVERLNAALADLGGEGDEPARAELCARIAESHWAVGSSELALEWAERALALAERLDLTELFTGALSWRAAALFALGRRREALLLNEGILAFAEESGSQRARAEALLSRGIFTVEDDPPAALRAQFDSAEAARKAGSRPIEATALANAAEAAVDLGRWVEADAALAALGEMGLSGFFAGGVALSAAILAAYRGDFVSAEARLQETASAETTDFLAARTWYLRARSLVALLRGDLELAYEHGMDAVHADPAGMNTPNSVWDAARAALWLRDPNKVREALEATAPMRGRWAAAVKTTLRAGLAALEGRSEEASSGYREALDTWSSMDVPIDYAFTAIDAITLLPGDPVAIEAADRARGMLTELGAKPLLERLAMAEQPAPVEAT